MTDEQYETLVVRAVDGRISPAEKETLMTHLIDRPERRKDYESQLALKALTDGWVARLEQDVLRDAVSHAPGQRYGRWIAWAFLSLSLLLLTGGGLYEVWADPAAPVWLKVGLALGGLGSVLLTAVVLRARNATPDPYTKVIR